MKIEYEDIDFDITTAKILQKMETPIQEKLIKAEEYLKDFIFVIKGDSAATYYSTTQKRVVNVNEIEEFLKTL